MRGREKKATSRPNHHYMALWVLQLMEVGRWERCRGGSVIVYV
jgi:hypothetical protein